MDVGEATQCHIKVTESSRRMGRNAVLLMIAAAAAARISIQLLAMAVRCK